MSDQRCPACRHPSHGPECRVEIMVESRYDPIPPFHLQCWCDGATGSVVKGKETVAMAKVYRILSEET